ncbi:MAG: glycosyltransferase family 4 protein, partial [Deltaproteobacteria bacterium]|nr:glycosyltransferase family 4 protein [Deltaproteobacteria bacterium]
MRVCHIISGDQWAGAEVMNYRLLQGLKEFKDLELFAILLNEGKVAEEFRKLGVKVIVIQESGRNFFELLAKTRRSVQTISPDIVHSHRMKENILAYHSSKSRKKSGLICTQHGMPEPLDGKMKALKRFVLSKYHFGILSRRFRKVVVVSEDIRNRFLRGYGFPEERIEMIHNGTDIPDRCREARNEGFFVIGSAGRLFPVKDYPLMVEIAREVTREASGVRFELAGEGPEKDRLLELIKKNGLERHFLLKGFVEDIPRFYEGLDLYINTSLHEGLPMSILEAMSHGLPIIAPDTGGLREIIEDGRHGFLLKGRNPRAYSDSCLRLIANRALLREMGDRSREKIRNEFSCDEMTEKYYR